MAEKLKRVTDGTFYTGLSDVKVKYLKKVKCLKISEFKNLKRNVLELTYTNQFEKELNKVLNRVFICI